MRDYDFWVEDDITINNQINNKKAVNDQKTTIELIDSIGGLKGNVLDIGGRNLFTGLLEKKYSIQIDSTSGDLDEEFICPKSKYDFIHYNNVIEHQFNPLYTLLRIKEHLNADGTLILGCPLKPSWITSSVCHFHEFDKYRYAKLISRAGFAEIKRVHYYYQFSLNGIRGIAGSFYKRQVISLLKPKID